jgi:transaldolase/glucose-6-phosphate isomerase
MSPSLPPTLAAAVDVALASWRREGKLARLWDRDATLWTGGDESRWLGWLDLPAAPSSALAPLHELAAAVRDEGFQHVLLLGMGGSSLWPEVLARTFAPLPGWPRLVVLDSTDPQQVRDAEAAVDLARTLVVVASKSGSTLEPSVMMAHFRERLRATVGAERAGRQLVAITDPGSQLEREATADGFRAVVHGIPSVGGRFSALSVFGLLPAALVGLDLERLLGRARSMAAACRLGAGDGAPLGNNPGVSLGVLLGQAALRGRDKLTLFASPGLEELGAWLEQLVAESTGKRGRAIIPVDREPALPARSYGEDRVFVAYQLEGEELPHRALLDELEALGHPVVRFVLPDTYELGAEVFRWEIATAVAGAELGVHPFDQPDVEASKIATRALTQAFDEQGALPPEEPCFRDGELALFADPATAALLRANLGGQAALDALLRVHLDQLRASGPGHPEGDYLALLAYLPMRPAHREPLDRMRASIAARKRVATCLGFGPRFLHSTGQAYKGGSNAGVFLQLTCDDAADLPIPGRRASFGVVKAAQARGDLAVLIERGRRVLRVHLGPDVAAGLAQLEAAVERAL